MKFRKSYHTENLRNVILKMLLLIKHRTKAEYIKIIEKAFFLKVSLYKSEIVY